MKLLYSQKFEIVTNYTIRGVKSYLNHHKNYTKLALQTHRFSTARDIKPHTIHLILKYCTQINNQN